VLPARPKPFGQDRRKTVSSAAARSGSPGGTSSATASRAAARPSSTGSQRARAKNECARSCGHALPRPAPSSIPVTVRRRGWAASPAARAQNVRKPGAVKHGRNADSKVRGDFAADLAEDD
jgi:hypothetical protein